MQYVHPQKTRSEVLAIIPARGGSKGVPKKNIRQILNKPLITYSIDASLSSHTVTRTVISTENDEIAHISKNAGGEVIIRPDDLSSDDAKSVDVILHCLDTLNDSGYSPEILILLQPTSPCRISDDIDNAIALFKKSDADTVVSICEINHSPFWSFTIKNNYLEPLFGTQFLNKRRQELPKTVMPNGAIYITTPDYLQKTKDFFVGKVLPFMMPKERSIDIDTEFDLCVAETILKHHRIE